MQTNQAFTIEVQGAAAGLVVGGRGGFTFFASDWAFKDLDQRVFRHVRQAERAAADLVANRRTVRPS